MLAQVVRNGAIDVLLFVWLFMKIDLSRPLDFSITLALVIFVRICGECVARRVPEAFSRVPTSD